MELNTLEWTVVVAKLAEWSPRIPDVRRSNLVIGKILE